ncbi:hypothetical protein AMAG_16884 [Allomyces macrogynus ATCC 38327]|uniref:Uncharacterized protein n=1 Tax=Allomyces macrogynus (strain ATCC 38327) TaxID=578462 RepID=A0A0L0TCG2_ALLM3|nr:hypothetical protein AMAG_16884 [Allomyces macrogynus ATCC 38327]|eukprot:KNE72401.1 hypothetical protein AMAG_16884 [Allomyces macrogynus ATCC 38327]
MTDPDSSGLSVSATDCMIMHVLDRAVAAKAQWSKAMIDAQTAVAKNRVHAVLARPRTLVVLELANARGEIRVMPADVFPCEDVCPELAEKERATDYLVAILGRTLAKSDLLHALDVHDPIPWRHISLSAISQMTLAYLLSPHTSPLAAPDPPLLPGPVGAALGAPSGIPLASRPTVLDRRPKSLVNYNNTATARAVFVSPPGSATVPLRIATNTAAGMTTGMEPSPLVFDKGRYTGVEGLEETPPGTAGGSVASGLEEGSGAASSSGWSGTGAGV